MGHTQLHLRLLTLGFVLMLCSCSTLTKRNVERAHAMSWEVRKVQLASIQAWNLSGAIGLRTETEGINASINWNQTKEHYDLRFFGPIGIGSVKIHGNSNGVVLQTSTKERSIAETPEELMQAQLGWYLPVSNLYYWIRGIPAPHFKSKTVLGPFNHLTKLYQQGWEIEYQRYSVVGNMELPTKITLKNPTIRVRIVIREWDINPSKELVG